VKNGISHSKPELPKSNVIMNFDLHSPIETPPLFIRPYSAADLNAQTDAVLESVSTVGRWLLV